MFWIVTISRYCSNGELGPKKRSRSAKKLRRAGAYKNGFKGRKNEGLIPIREAFAKKKLELERMKAEYEEQEKKMRCNSRGLWRRREADNSGSPKPPQPQPKKEDSNAEKEPIFLSKVIAMAQSDEQSKPIEKKSKKYKQPSIANFFPKIFPRNGKKE